jgi:solute carrier family 25 oxoglutarate transporter 11
VILLRPIKASFEEIKVYYSRIANSTMGEPKSTPSQKSLSTRIADAVQPFAIGGFSGICATTVIQPIDTVKVRIQLLGKAKAKDPSISTSPLDVARKIKSEDGIKGFYKGYCDFAHF